VFGWPTSLPTGARANQIFLSNVQGARDIPYRKFALKYNGSGTIKYPWGTKVIETKPGRDVIEIPAGALGSFDLTATDPNNYIRNISIVPLQFEELHAQGEIFNPDWLARVENFRAFRFMEWQKTNGSKQSAWANRPIPSHKSWAANGVPLEIMLALANKVGIDPWFSMPHLADDKYLSSFAFMVKSKLNRNLTVFVEHSNEVWNWGFEQAQYAHREGQKRWGTTVGDAWVQWHGMKTAQICDTWAGIWVSERERLQCMLGVHTGWMGLEKASLECPKWVAEVEGRQACGKHNIDGIAVTGYFTAGLTGEHEANNPTIEAWMTGADKGLGKAFVQLQYGKLLPKGGDNTPTTLAVNFKYHRDVANKWGIKYLHAYEGGSHITANGNSKQNVQSWIDFHIAINRDARMEQRYDELFKTWQSSIGSEGVFFHFEDISSPSRFGSWGGLEGLWQTTSPKWDSIQRTTTTP
jgi:hypothetical protein